MADPLAHILTPHLAEPDDTQAYETLLAALRKDLLLDPATDIQAGTYAALLNLGIDRGTVTLTWSASAVSNTVTVQHRLGVVPTAIILTADNATAANLPVANVHARTTTDFTVSAEQCTGATFTGTDTMDWVAIA